MKADELEDIWQAYDAKLEESLQLNIRVIEKIEGQKVHRSFNALVRFKIYAVVFGFFWNAFLFFLLYHTWRETFFAVSVILLILVNFYAMVQYIRQVAIIREINFSDSIADTQKKLTRLQISAIQTFRVIFLQLPLWTIFYIKVDMIKHAGGLYWLIQSVITLLAIWLSIWMYRNVSVKNAGSRLVKAMIYGDGGKSIARAMKFIKEIEEFKKETLL